MSNNQFELCFTINIGSDKRVRLPKKIADHFLEGIVSFPKFRFPHFLRQSRYTQAYAKEKNTN